MEETADRYIAYYGKNRIPLDPKLAPERCRKVGEQLNDISFFMRQIHQKYTFYINRVHNRRGTLWADRFKSTILEGEHALWNCVKYIELNAVRANLVDDPADYRFCTWGNFCGSDRHVFGDNFVKHMRKSLGEIAKQWTDEELYGELRGEIARTISYESGAEEDLHKIKKNKGKKIRDGVIILDEIDDPNDIDRNQLIKENSIMRTARKKMVGRSCYYHACARIAGAKDDYLFTEVDKEKGMKIVQDLARLFFVEPISMCWMGNHWHIVLYVGDRRPSLEEIKK